MSSVYKVNKSINRSIEFKGLKAQYIWWLGGGVIALMIIYAVMYVVGVNTYVSLGSILIMGAGIVAWVYRVSNKYGEFGMMKKIARRGVPGAVISRSRKIFQKQ